MQHISDNKKLSTKNEKMEVSQTKIVNESKNEVCEANGKQKHHLTL